MMGGAPYWIGVDMAAGPDMTAIHIVPPITAEPVAPRSISPEAAVRVAAALLNVEEVGILSHRRDPRLAEARALVVWTLRAVPASPLSYPRIGRAIGDRDHSGVIKLHRMAIRLRLENSTFAKCCTALALHFGLTQEARHVSR